MNSPAPLVRRSISTPVALAAILLLALGVRLAFVSRVPAEAVFANVDAKGYRLLAENLLRHGVFSFASEPPFTPDGLRTPVYPAFLAAAFLLGGDNSRTVLVAQALVDTLTVAAVFGLASALTTRRHGFYAALLYALNPVSVLFIGEALAEVLLAFLLALTFYVYALALTQLTRRAWLWALAGALVALCVLCKPNVVLLPAILIVGLLLELRSRGRHVLKHVALLAGATVFAVSPWLLRNRLAYGQWTLSSAFDDNLALVSAVATTLEVRGEVVAPWTPRWEETYMREIVAPTASQYRWAEQPNPPTGPEQALRYRQMAAVAMTVIRSHPGAFLASHLKGALRSFVPSMQRNWYAYLTGQSWPAVESMSSVLRSSIGQMAHGDHAGAFALVRAWWGEHPALARMLLLLSFACSALTFVLIAAGLYSLRKRPGLMLAIGLTLAYLVLLPGPIGYLRFWVPGLPLGVVLMACAFRKRARHAESVGQL